MPKRYMLELNVVRGGHLDDCVDFFDTIQECWDEAFRVQDQLPEGQYVKYIWVYDTRDNNQIVGSSGVPPALRLVQLRGRPSARYSR